MEYPVYCGKSLVCVDAETEEVSVVAKTTEELSGLAVEVRRVKRVMESKHPEAVFALRMFERMLDGIRWRKQVMEPIPDGIGDRSLAKDRRGRLISDMGTREWD